MDGEIGESCGWRIRVWEGGWEKEMGGEEEALEMNGDVGFGFDDGV